jgi:sugar O-acyltransferase (sialic acid O-acetyltransferase NeuD family)
MKRAIIGAGGFANEVRAHMGDCDIPSFVSDEYFTPNKSNILPLSKFNPREYIVLVAVGNPMYRYNIQQILPKETKYFSFIHPSAIILGNDVEIGDGSIICAGCIITTNIKIGRHSHLNLSTTIGHDCRIGDFFTTAPGVKISGNCEIGNRVYFGTNSSTKEKVSITDDVTVGLNSGVVKSIYESGIYVGTPAKLINK